MLDHNIEQETLFSNGSDFYERMLEDISNASEAITLEMYIFKKDALGEKIISALITAAARGVNIKILIDGAGSPFWITNFQPLLKKTDIEYKIYHPFPWQFWNWSHSVTTRPLILKLIYLLFKMARRNHRKVCIIDNNIAYLGSLNICLEHLSPKDGGQNWRDIGVRLKNYTLTELSHAFEHAWHHRTVTERLKTTFKKTNKDPIFRLNNSWHRRRILYRNILSHIRKAKKRVWITNPYFIPDNLLLLRLNQAAKRGLEVCILLPKAGDTFLPMPWAAATFYESLLKHGIKIFEYTPSILHTKALIVDDWVMVGSSNLDHLSLLHNLEVDIRLSHEKSKQDAIDIFNDTLLHSNEITLKNWRQHRPWYQIFIGYIILTGKYFI